MNGQVKIGIRNMFVVGIMSLLFIWIAKILTAKYEVPGVTTIVQAI